MMKRRFNLPSFGPICHQVSAAHSLRNFVSRFPCFINLLWNLRKPGPDLDSADFMTFMCTCTATTSGSGPNFRNKYNCIPQRAGHGHLDGMGQQRLPSYCENVGQAVQATASQASATSALAWYPFTQSAGTAGSVRLSGSFGGLSSFFSSSLSSTFSVCLMPYFTPPSSSLGCSTDGAFPRSVTRPHLGVFESAEPGHRSRLFKRQQYVSEDASRGVPWRSQWFASSLRAQFQVNSPSQFPGILSATAHCLYHRGSSKLDTLNYMCLVPCF